MRHDLTNILKIDTSSGDMNEKVDHWFDSFKKVPQEVYYDAFNIDICFS